MTTWRIGGSLNEQLTIEVGTSDPDVVDAIERTAAENGVELIVTVDGEQIEELYLPDAGQTRCVKCGWDASFSPPEIVNCLSCGGPLLYRRDGR